MKSDVGLSKSYAQYAALAQINGNYPAALRYRILSLRAAEKTKDFNLITSAYSGLAEIYKESGDFKNAISYLEKAKSIFEQHWKPRFDPGVDHTIIHTYFDIVHQIAQSYERFNKLDSALKYANFLFEAYVSVNNKMDWPSLLYTLGNLHSKMGKNLQSINYYRSGATIANANDIKKEVMDNYSGLSRTFMNMQQVDSSIIYAYKVLQISGVAQNTLVKLEAFNLLARAFKVHGKNDSVVKYLQLAIATKDSLFNQQKVTEIQSMGFNEQLRQKEIQQERAQFYNRIRNYLLTGGVAVLLIVAAILYKSNRQKQKSKLETEKAYTELKLTQAQLIQSAKMASLGELTAGIAHEIQNPLNFVNNFSEVSVELLNELKDGLHQNLPQKAKVEADALLKDLLQNLDKIIDHGKRADAIVKGMLQHSRTSTGKKEATNINALADEYLRLSYHGIHAKNTDVNVTLHTYYDQNIGKIDIIPQEIGRLLLNLFANAFYSVCEKKIQKGEAYEPTITLNTRKMPGKIEIEIADNGIGIPEKLLDKIFQPFFTTKPAGQATGLGLSLSYDIINAVGGGISVETKEGEGAKFIIQLPNM